MLLCVALLAVGAVVAFVVVSAACRAVSARSVTAPRTLRSVAFLHPDLGIGGAERLVVDAAMGLVGQGVRCVMYTAHHDPSHCFLETRDGSLPVVVAGDWLPRHIKGKGHVLFATLRMLWLTVWVMLKGEPVDCYIVDQVSLPLFLLSSFSARPTLFYCHFPDKLCDATLGQKRGLVRRVYRLVFDTIEEQCLKRAGSMVFNSQFTKDTTLATFPSLRRKYEGQTGDILYPPVNWSKLADEPDHHPEHRLDKLRDKVLVVSINRFEGKKNVELAVEAFAEVVRRVREGECELRRTANEDKRGASSLALVLAGGYDVRLPENVSYMERLKEVAKQRGVADMTHFLPSFSEYEKYHLLHLARVVVYTPCAEHFGIVPLEAMYCRRCVVAVNRAGPTESVVDGVTGYLKEPTPSDFADGICSILADPNHCCEMGEKARGRAVGKFSLSAFTASLKAALDCLVG